MKKIQPTNKNGLTFFEWYQAANLVGSAPNLPNARKAWGAGVDPAKYAVKDTPSNEQAG